MGFGRFLFLCALSLLIAAPVYAQTADYHVGFGMKLDRSKPPETFDMSGVGTVYGPAPGKTLQVFILSGEFGRRGPWLSKFLPRSDRAGASDVLMFDDRQWEPLRPVGVRHGLEVVFGRKMAELMPGETIGIIVVPADKMTPLELVGLASKSAPCHFVAVVRIQDDNLISLDEFKALLSAHQLLDVNMTPWFSTEPTDLYRLEVIQDKGAAMAQKVFDQTRNAKEE